MRLSPEWITQWPKRSLWLTVNRVTCSFPSKDPALGASAGQRGKRERGQAEGREGSRERGQRIWFGNVPAWILNALKKKKKRQSLKNTKTAKPPPKLKPIFLWNDIIAYPEQPQSMTAATGSTWEGYITSLWEIWKVLSVITAWLGTGRGTALCSEILLQHFWFSRGLSHKLHDSRTLEGSPQWLRTSTGIRRGGQERMELAEEAWFMRMWLPAAPRWRCSVPWCHLLLVAFTSGSPA